MRGAMLLLVLVLLVPLTAVRRGLVLGAPPDESEEPSAVHLGAGSCAAQACHGSGETRMEYKIWKTKDRHSSAFATLAGPAGRRMGERLGIDPTTDASCLCCHGTTGVETAPSFDAADGVSCELCHGGAEGWLGLHVTPGWKDRTPAQKAEQGMRDLTTAERRAASCIPCHVGDQDHPIPHRVLAAGHPALSFDAAFHLEQMPPHWQPRRAVHPVAIWVASLRQSAIATLELATRAARERSGWPEFALFDCYSCHHPIHSRSVYETAALPGGPGELPLDLAPLRVLLQAVGDRSLLDRYAGLMDRTLRQDEQARDFAAYAEAMALELRQVFADADRYGDADAGRFRANLVRYLERALRGEVRLPRHEMKQIAMAALSLAEAKGGAPFRESLDRLHAALAPGAAYDMAACAQLALEAFARIR